MKRLLTTVCALVAIPTIAASAASVTQNLAIKVTPVVTQVPTAVSFSPAGPVNVVDNSPSGTFVSAVQVTTSDGQPCNGCAVSITSQSTAGMVALSSGALPSNVVVSSINNADDGPESVTVQACENATCVSGTLGMTVAPPTQSSGLLPADRDASANWKMAGLQSVGGIPNRTVICATIGPLGGGQDDTANIQSAIDACPVGQVVSLVAGTFTINEGSIIHLSRAITLRGAGPTATFLTRTNGAQLGSYMPGSNQSELIRVSGSGASGSTVALAADAAQGSNSVQVSNASGYSVGEIVLLDEASGAGWQTDRSGQGSQVWASSDYRVVWNIHNPGIGGDDCCIGNNSTIFGYFQTNPDHPTNEMHQISAISGNTISFDSPVMISYRTSHGAQLTPMLAGPTNAGVEELAVRGGDNGNIRFEGAAYAWAKDVDSSLWLNEGFAIDGSFRVQLEGIYSHKAVWPVPGGGGYAISLAFGSSEVLIENSISVLANKVMVARASGAGSVVAYNYMDDGFISGSDGWQEIGLNASHLAGPHHVLFEGNWGFNADSDQTHGNAIYHTFYRNWLTGYRQTFTDYLNNTVINDTAGCCGPLRAGGAHAFAYWFSFLGNVLGLPGHTSGLVYDGIGGTNSFPPNAIWMLGWVDISPQGYDPNVASTAIRDGNFDYLTNSVKWAASDTAHVLPNSLYLSSKPAFFTGGASTWPWVNPTGSPQVFTNPAKARYDAGTPFTQP